MMKKIVSLFLAVLLALNPVVSRADAVLGSLQLPVPGTRIALSQSFSPSLLRGMVVYPNKPLQFDFIVDTGDDHLAGDALKRESQRMVNYFLAALTIPQKDLWVNLSPVEHDRIIPDALIKTELGRDLLAEDYVLKQLAASLIYPEDRLGKAFWQRIYDEAYQKFGVTDIPVDVFNKVWIVPETASVFEKGNAVYITKAHMKVMLEADYLAMSHGATLNVKATQGDSATTTFMQNMLREVIVPAIEKEVNEGKNFARLRQVVYSLILAQWYQDVLKESVLNRVYSGKSKVSGIDLSDPKNKERIYQQYMAAYKKGVFNYIKEETDRLTHEAVPRKYFSGGVEVRHIARTAEAPSAGFFTGRRGKDGLVKVDVSPAQNDRAQNDFVAETHEAWNDLNRPAGLLKELKDCWSAGVFIKEKAADFLRRYSPQIDAEVERGNPVQGSWPVLKAVVDLEYDREKNINQEKELVDWIEQTYPKGTRTRLMEQVLLMNGRYDSNWVKENMPDMVDLPYYFIAMEIDFKAGGLGPVNVTHSKFLHRLGAMVRTIQPMYTHRFDTGIEGGEPLNYEQGIIEKYRVERAGLNWAEFFLKLTGGAEPLAENRGDGVICLKKSLDEIKEQLILVFGRQYAEEKIIPFLQQTQTNLGFTGLRKITSYKVNIGKKKNNGEPDLQTAEIWEGVNKEKVSGYMIKHVREDGTSFYTKTLYRYNDEKYNPISMEESMAFFNVAAAEWINQLEKKRAQELQDKYVEPIVHAQDGQMAFFFAILKSLFPWLKNAFFMGTTHTILNVGANGIEAVQWFLKDMLGISPEYIPAFITTNYFHSDTGEIRKSSNPFIQYTQGMMVLAQKRFKSKSGLRTGVSWTHAVRDMSRLYEMPLMAITNGDDPERIGSFFRNVLQDMQKEGKIPEGVHPNRLSPVEAQLVKEECAKRFNDLKILTARGVDLLNLAKSKFGRKYAEILHKPLRTLTDLEKEDAEAIMRETVSWLKVTFKDGDEGLKEFRERFYVKVDPKKPQIGSARRLVIEKNNFDPELIRMLVRQGFEVVIFGNYQGPMASGELSERYKGLEQEIAEAQKKDPKEYSGKFSFVQNFTEEEKFALIAMVNIYMMLNKKFLGANELWEENALLSYALMLALDHGGRHGDGATTDVLSPIDFNKSGSGSLVMLRDGGSVNEWLGDLGKLEALWAQGLPFFERVVQSAKRSRIGEGQLTAAAYLWAANDVIKNARADREQERKERAVDRQVAQKIVDLMGNVPDIKEQILNNGTSGITPFYFRFSKDQGRAASNAGLKGFLGTLQRIEQEWGYSAFFEQMNEKATSELPDQPPGMRAVCSRFLLAVFGRVPQAKEAFDQWLMSWENDPGSSKDRDERLQRFLGDIIQSIEHPEAKGEAKDADPAQGGIDARNISVDRQGGLMQGVVSDRALEEVLMNAPGLRGVIVSITPIPSLFNLLIHEPPHSPGV